MSDTAAVRHRQARKGSHRRELVGRRAPGVLPGPAHITPTLSSGGSPAEIYALFDPDRSGGPFGSVDPFVVRTALTLLTRMFGLPLAVIDLAPPLFSIRFPKHAAPEEARAVIGPQLPRYHGWRRVVLDAQMLATRGPVDQDPWDGLRRVARLTLGGSASNMLYTLEHHFPEMAPAGLTLARVLEVEAGLASMPARELRRAIRILSDLHEYDLAVATGLLPPRFAPLPPRDRVQDHLPLPPRLAAAVADKPTALRFQTAYCWTVAVRAGLIPEDSDLAPPEFLDSGMWESLSAANPTDYGLKLTHGTWGIYLRAVADVLIAGGAQDPRVATIAGAWAALLAAIRATGQRTDVLSAIASPAKDEGLRPSDITPIWVAERLASVSSKQRNPLRSACLRLDGVRADAAIPAHLLPAVPTGIVRKPRRPRQTPAAAIRESLAPPVEQTWIDMFAAMRRAGVSEEHLHPVYAARSAAIADDLTPRDVDLAWIEACRSTTDRSTAAKFAPAARLLDRLRDQPELAAHLPPSPIGAPTDRRRSAGKLRTCVATELDGLLTAQGAAASTQREASNAVCALADALAARSAGSVPTSLVGLLRTEMRGLDWGRHADRAPAHEKVLRRLREFQDLPWTSCWHRLQAAVVAAGVPMRDNPVPALLRHAGGRSPLELDVAWAQTIDRSLRRHGRADLALTFVSSIRRLDALHARANLAGSGLLPPLIGPVREKPPAQVTPTVRREPDPVAEAWVALTAAVRVTGRKTNILSMLASPAKVAGLRPQDLTAAWCAALLSTLCDQRAKATRSACFLLDELRDDPRIPAGLLSAEPTGIVRKNARRRAS